VNADLKKIIKECTKWSVKTEKVTKGFFDSGDLDLPEDFNFAPFTDYLGLSLNKKTIYYVEEYEPLLRGSEILHELAHIIIAQPVKAVDEVLSGMLAFEYITAKMLRLENWEKSMWNYTIGASKDANTWGDAGRKQKNKIIKESLPGAIKIGIISINKKPTYRII
jgi:hypothetical protein